ncbi:MAG: multidrug effflux MFS transporter [Aestuariivita sp.]|nr:multidrug effflux MFS transporter [Aestuariivita sp.]
MMFATIAFSIDAMLPAFPNIGAELSPQSPNRAQLILTSFILGMGLGTFVTGPLSDAFGRKPVIIIGAICYIGSSAAAYFSTSLDAILFFRMLQGISAAAPRVVSLAIVRDLYSGREMAQVISLAMMVFTVFPAFAPLIGVGLIAISGWRSIFLAFIVFAMVSTIWMWIRQPETLRLADRRPFEIRLLLHAVREMFAHPTVRLSIFVQSICLGILFSMLASVQPIYDITFDKAESFPYWFGAVAIIAGSGSLINAAIVINIGMRRIVTWSLLCQIILSAIVILVSISESGQNSAHFPLFLFWQIYVFFMAGTTMGNLNSIAMEPMGHIAGMAASIISGIGTVIAALIAVPVGLLFDGSTLPLSVGICLLSIAGFSLMICMARIEH